MSCKFKICSLLKHIATILLYTASYCHGLYTNETWLHIPWGILSGSHYLDQHTGILTLLSFHYKSLQVSRNP